MRGSLAVDLGVGPNVWLFLTILGCATLFFKFSRIWSVRNLDLLLLFAFAPAWGPNKKDAEQRAARNALAQFEGKAPPFAAD